MKTMSPPHLITTAALWQLMTHALGHMIYGYTLLIPMNQTAQ